MSIVEVNVANHEVEGQPLNQVQENEENNCQIVYSDFIDIILKVIAINSSIFLFVITMNISFHWQSINLCEEIKKKQEY